MSSMLHVPSLEQVQALAESAVALGATVVTVSRSLDYCVWKYEELLAEGLGTFADALRPLRGLIEGAIAGWEDNFADPTGLQVRGF
jgi:hypothetical protein